MNKTLQIAKGLSTEVRVMMVDGQEILGRFFLAENARNHAGPESLFDLFSESGLAFLPFCPNEGDSVTLVNRSRIMGLCSDGYDDGLWSGAQEDEGESWLPAEVSMAGKVIKGNANIGGMPPERRRLADLLNHVDSFIEFESDYGPWILNKNHLNYLVPLS